MASVRQTSMKNRVADKRYWFARAGKRGSKYPDAFVPITVEGQIIYAALFAGLILAWVALIVLGQVYHEPIWAAVVTFALLAVSVGLYAFVSRRFGDHEHTKAEYKSGKVSIGGQP